MLAFDSPLTRFLEGHLEAVGWENVLVLRKLLGLLFFGLACLLTYRLATQRPTESRVPRLLRDDFFLSVAFLALLLSRIPVLVLSELNPDESFWMVEADRLLEDARFWYAVDGTTSGPLVVYPLTLIGLAGIPLSYGAVRLFDFFVFLVPTLWIFFRVLRLVFSPVVTRLAFIPLVTGLLLTQTSDFLAYNGEHVGLLFLALLLYVHARVFRGTHSLLTLFGGGLLVSLSVFVKFQMIPQSVFIALAIGAELLVQRKLTLRALLVGSAGVVLPLLVTAWVLGHLGTFDEFYFGYIQQNLSYTGRGIQNNGNLLLVSQYADFFLVLEDLLWAYQAFLPLLVLLPVLVIGFHRVLEPAAQRYALFAVGLAVVGLWTIAAPKNFFFHYKAFNWLPLTLVVASFLSTLGRGLPTVLPTPNPETGYRVGAALWLLAVGVGVGKLLLENSYVHPPMTMPRAFAERFRTGPRPVAQVLRGYAPPGRHLGLWGWDNALFVETGLRCAHRIPNPFYAAEPAYPLQKQHLANYLHDLARQRPEVFVDALRTPDGWGLMKDSVRYDLRRYPPLMRFLTTNYRYQTAVDGFRVYVRRDWHGSVAEWFPHLTFPTDEPLALHFPDGAAPAADYRLRPRAPYPPGGDGRHR